MDGQPDNENQASLVSSAPTAASMIERLGRTGMLEIALAIARSDAVPDALSMAPL